MASIFEIRDYRQAIKNLMETRGQNPRGLQTRLANHIGCQQAYLSRVLGEKADLSQEQAFSTAAFFNLDQLETEYFITLVNYNRAGSTELRRHYKKKLDDSVAKKLEIKSRIDVADQLKPEQKAIYYSDWIYSALHILTTIERFRTIQKIAVRLKQPEARIATALEFLESCGLVKKEAGQYINTVALLFLPGDSNFIRQHHINWRLRAVDAISRQDPQSLNYSGVVACSEADGIRIREILLETLQKIRAVVKSSTPDEQLFCYSLDFFEP